MGVDFAKAALAAGHTVVATGRDTDAGPRLWEIRRPADRQARRHHRTDAEARLGPPSDRFPAASTCWSTMPATSLRLFEELTPEQIDRQSGGTLPHRPDECHRAVLPIMRKHRSGHIISISSTAGPSGLPSVGICRGEFGLEGWMGVRCSKRLRRSASPPDREPGSFRTELLEPASVTYAEPFHRGLRRPHGGAAESGGSTERPAGR